MIDVAEVAEIRAKRAERRAAKDARRLLDLQIRQSHGEVPIPVVCLNCGETFGHRDFRGQHQDCPRCGHGEARYADG